MIQTSDHYFYDTTKRRYIVTSQGANDLIGIDVMNDNKLTNQDDVDFLLDRASRNIYTYIYNLRSNRGSKYTKRKSILEFLIFKNENNELENLIEAILEQIVYITQSGGDLMINEYENNGVLLSMDQKNELLVSPVAKMMLNENILGTNSKFAFRIPVEEYRVGY